MSSLARYSSLITVCRVLIRDYCGVGAPPRLIRAVAAALVAAFMPLREGGGGEHEQSGRRVDVPGLAGTQGSRVASENLISPRVIG